MNCSVSEISNVTLDGEVHQEHLSTDALSLRLWQKGNMRGYNDLVERYKKPLFVFITRILRDTDEAKDVLQETFIRLYRSKERLREDKNLKSWLYQTANNLCIDYLRKMKPGRTVTVDHKESSFEATVNRSDLENPRQPDTLYEEMEFHEKILQAIETLPKKQRLIMSMRSCKDLSLKEIAKIIGCNEKTVGTTLFAARKKLMDQLSPLIYELYGCTTSQWFEKGVGFEKGAGLEKGVEK